jgi:hypothetical protein
LKKKRVTENLFKIEASDIDRMYHAPITNIAITCEGLYLFSRDGMVNDRVARKQQINEVGANYISD